MIFQQMSMETKKRLLQAIPISFNFWEEFQFEELTENMRQKEDPAFAELLNRLRFGNSNNDDLNLLKQRLLNRDPADSFIQHSTKHYLKLRESFADTMCLFATNNDVNEFNKIITKELKIQTNNIEALDSDKSRILFNREPNQNPIKRKRATKHKKISQTAGLETYLNVGVGSRVMLRRNIDNSKGLVNGALGTVVGFNYGNDNSTVNNIIINFDQIPGKTIVDRISADFEKQRNFYVTRSQFPITLAWALTVHKSQGLSIKHLMIDLSHRLFEPAMAYVALSRAHELKNVYLIEFDHRILTCHQMAFEEYKRLYNTNNSYKMPFEKCNLVYLISEIDTIDPPISITEFKKSLTKNLEITTNRAKKFKINEILNNKYEEYENINNYIGHLTNYPILFFNIDNSCYSNCFLQCLLHLGHKFFELILSEPTVINNFEHSFKYIFLSYYNKMYITSNPGERNTTLLFRRFVADFPLSNANHPFTDNSMQDLLSFFLEFSNHMSTRVQKAYKLTIKIKKICSKCTKSSLITDRCVSHISFPLSDLVPFTDFYSNFNRSDIMPCDNCNLNTIHYLKHNYHIPHENLFLIGYTSFFKFPHKIDSIMSNYDPNLIKIPKFDQNGIYGSQYCQNYRISSLIIRLGHSREVGHFVIYTRSLKNNNWLYISDDSYRTLEKLPQKLSDIFMWVLEKIN